MLVLANSCVSASVVEAGFLGREWGSQVAADVEMWHLGGAPVHQADCQVSVVVRQLGGADCLWCRRWDVASVHFSPGQCLI